MYGNGRGVTTDNCRTKLRTGKFALFKNMTVSGTLR